MILLISSAFLTIPMTRAEEGYRIYYKEIPNVTGFKTEIPPGWKVREDQRKIEWKGGAQFVLLELVGPRGSVIGVLLYVLLPGSDALYVSLLKEKLFLENFPGSRLISRSIIELDPFSDLPKAVRLELEHERVRATFIHRTGPKLFYVVYVLEFAFIRYSDEKEGDAVFDRILSTSDLVFRATFKVEAPVERSIPIKIQNLTDSIPKVMYLSVFKDYGIEAPEEVQLRDGERLSFRSWKFKLGNLDWERSDDRVLKFYNGWGEIQATAVYAKQYYMKVASEYGQVSGSGWYDEGSWAKVSLEATIVGGPLIRHRFSHWAGDASGSDPIISVRMDGPKVVRAVWVEDYANLYAFIIVLAIAAVGAALVLVKRKRGLAIQPQPPPMMPPPAPPMEAQAPAQPPEAPPAPQAPSEAPAQPEMAPVSTAAPEPTEPSGVEAPPPEPVEKAKPKRARRAAARPARAEPKKRFCIHCGAEIPAIAKFCPECGKAQ